MRGNFTCWAPLLPPCSDGDWSAPHIQTAPQQVLGSTKSPEGRREGQADKKALSPCRHQTTGQWGAPSKAAEVKRAASRTLLWQHGQEGNESIQPKDWPRDDSEIIFIFEKANKHVHQKKKIKKKKRKKIPAKLGLIQLCGGPVLVHKRCIPKWKCSVPQC